jgi:hypothetical protein
VTRAYSVRQTQVLDQLGQVAGRVRPARDGPGFLASAMASRIDGDDPVTRRQGANDLVPAAGVEAGCVYQQNHGVCRGTPLNVGDAGAGRLIFVRDRVALHEIWGHVKNTSESAKNMADCWNHLRGIQA